jgi:hypothetical protein
MQLAGFLETEIQTNKEEKINFVSLNSNEQANNI